MSQGASLPEGWAWSTLGEIGNYYNGRAFKESEWGTAGRPIIRIQNLTSPDKPYNYFDGEVDDRNRVRTGDLLVSWAATLDVFRWDGPDAVLNQHIFKVESFIDPDYHYFLLKNALSALREQAHGATMIHVTRGRFDATPVAIPPLGYQRAVVERLEQLASLLGEADGLIADALDELPDLELSAYFAAFSGDWTTKPLHEIAEVRLGRQRSPKNHSGPNMKPYLRAANVTWAGLDLSDVKEMNFTAEEVSTYRLEKGDILVAEASGSASEVGKPAIWDGEMEECCFQNTLLRVRAKTACPAYLHAFIRYLARSGQFAEASAGVGMNHLGRKRLADWPIPLPPQELQMAAVEDINRQLDASATLRRELEAVRSEISILRQVTMRRMLSGDLAVHARVDEGADSLLARARERRQAEKESALAARRAARKARAAVKAR